VLNLLAHPAYVSYLAEVGDGRHDDAGIRLRAQHPLVVRRRLGDENESIFRRKAHDREVGQQISKLPEFLDALAVLSGCVIIQSAFSRSSPRLSKDDIASFCPMMHSPVYPAGMLAALTSGGADGGE